MDGKTPLSRRSALRVIAAIAALPAVLRAVRPQLAAAQSVDMLKLQYHYRKFGRGRKKCWGCTHYIRRSRVLGDCGVLQTTVVWEGSCSAWQPKINEHD